jgi:hypothetical protein
MLAKHVMQITRKNTHFLDFVEQVVAVTVRLAYGVLVGAYRELMEACLSSNAKRQFCHARWLCNLHRHTNMQPSGGRQQNVTTHHVLLRKCTAVNTLKHTHTRLYTYIHTYMIQYTLVYTHTHMYVHAQETTYTPGGHRRRGT